MLNALNEQPNPNFHADLHRDRIGHKHNLGNTISLSDNNPHPISHENTNADGKRDIFADDIANNAPDYYAAEHPVRTT